MSPTPSPALWPLLAAAVILSVPPRPAGAVELRVDYGLDNSGFFNQPGARAAIEAVADFFSDLLDDELLEINPGTFGGSVSWTPNTFHPATGALTSFPGLVVPADTIIIYVGGRNLGGSTTGITSGGGWSASGSSAWFRRIRGRGQPGAEASSASQRTDFAPWGGSISFDQHSTRTWNFRTDGRPEGSATDFVSVALHEIGHIVGIGQADSWFNLVSSGRFTGARARAAFGGVNPPVETPGAGHWQDDGACEFPLGYDPENLLNVLSRTYASFGTGHGQNQIATMDPVSCSISTQTKLEVFTDLDLAALADLGWELRLPVTLDYGALSPSSAMFSWPSSTGVSYAVQRNGGLSSAAWQTISAGFAGDGSVQSWQDPSPLAGRGFYRLEGAPGSSAAASPDPSAAAKRASSSAVSDDETVTTVTVAPRTTLGCSRGRHE